jgi:hypothetical protein
MQPTQPPPPPKPTRSDGGVEGVDAVVHVLPPGLARQALEGVLAEAGGAPGGREGGVRRGVRVGVTMACVKVPGRVALALRN